MSQASCYIDSARRASIDEAMLMPRYVLAVRMGTKPAHDILHAVQQHKVAQLHALVWVASASHA